MRLRLAASGADVDGAPRTDDEVVAIHIGRPRVAIGRDLPRARPSGRVSMLARMAEATGPHRGGRGPPDPDRLAAAVREARDDAAPFALAAAGILVVLALVSRHAHWELLGHRLWWMWLVVAAPIRLPLRDVALRLGSPRPA